MKQTPGNYIQSLDPKGYVSNGEISSVDGQYLVRGSQNVVIKRSGRRGSSRGSVATRGGYTLKGAAKTMNRGISSSYTWKMNNGIKRSIRSYYDRAEVWFDGSWVQFMDSLTKVKFEFAEYWNDTEQIDELLFVNGTNNLYEWSGGIAKVASVTTTTITKQKYVTGTTYVFNDTGTISDPGSGFVVAGFEAGDEIVVSGSTSNDGTYTISTVEAGVITLVDDDVLTDEAAGATVIIKDALEGTWAEGHFLTSGTRSVYIDGTEYTYTGGESTGTLTGVTPDPSAGGVIADDVALQTVRSYATGDLTSGWGASYVADCINTIYNHVIVGSYTNRVLYLSKNTDFTDFGFTTPARAPGEGFEIILDAAPTAIVPDEDQLFLSAGEDFWYRVGFSLSGDNTDEAVTVERLKTATGQAARSQSTIIYIKNNIAFISFEPTVDTLGRIENIDTTQSVALSDDIKDDLEGYDLTDAHGLYWRRAIYIALPKENVVLIYDIRYEYWQPPQLLPVSRLAVIDNTLCGHSSFANETYILGSGYNDNGAPFEAVAAFGYDNFGTEFDLKQFDEVATVAKLSANTVLTNRVNYDYKGATEVREFEIDGSDTAITFAPNPQSGYGQNPLGYAPLGGVGVSTEDLSKTRSIDETPFLDFFERQRIFTSNAEDARWEILGYGENTKLSENEPFFIRR